MRGENSSIFNMRYKNAMPKNAKFFKKNRRWKIKSVAIYADDKNGKRMRILTHHRQRCPKKSPTQANHSEMKDCFE